LLGPRHRTLLWLASNFLPFRWIAALFLVGKAKRALRDAAAAKTPLPSHTFRQLAKGVGKTTPAKSLTKTARKGVAGTLKRL
jgi:hypothetical protein